MSPQRRRLHIVVTCAHRKHHPVPASLHLRRVTTTRAAARVTQWTGRLTSCTTETVQAGDLYAGEHWEIARTLPALAAGFTRPTLWVASAGWGLIPADAQIRPYAATFSPRHPDSVPGGARGAQDWWGAVGSWTGPAAGAPRTLTALAADHPRDRILLILSQHYFAACRGDLADALGSAADPILISVIAAGVPPGPGTGPWHLPACARLQPPMGGSLRSLNVRIAAHLLRAGLTDHEAMRRHLLSTLALAPDLPARNRQRLTDTEIIRFIRTHRSASAAASRARLLHELRDAGMACEQARFDDLFAAAARRRR